MSDHDAFLAAIRAAPADDLPRLVFADWLAENGEPDRAEFIRVQCALARHPAARLNPDATYGEYADLRRRERELWEKVQNGIPLPAPGWAWSLPHLPCDDWEPEGFFRRGFVDEIRCPLVTFLEHAEVLFRSHPITRVVLTDVRPELDSPWTYDPASGATIEFFRVGVMLHPWPTDKVPVFGGRFNSVEAADHALSVWLVAQARGPLGLPPLVPARVTA